MKARRIIAASLVTLLAGLAAVGSAQQAPNWPSENPPRPLQSRPVTFPPYEIRQLANGMQVIVVMHHEQPEISMRLLVRAGSAYDPPGKTGLARLAAGRVRFVSPSSAQEPVMMSHFAARFQPPGIFR